MQVTLTRQLAVSLFVALTSQTAFTAEAGRTCEQRQCGPTGHAQKLRINLYPDKSGNDPRKSDSRIEIYSPIGLVFSDKQQIIGPSEINNKHGKLAKTRGTGYMISPCFMQTVAHIAFGFNPKDSETRNVKVTLVAGNPARAFAGSIAGFGKGTEFGGNEWALIEFPASDCPGKQADIGYFDIANTPVSQLVGKVVSTAGFPVDRDVSVITVQHGCELTGEAPDGAIFTNCSVYAGSSGSPIFVSGKSGVPISLATVAAELNSTPKLTEYRLSITNVGLPHEQMFSDLKLRQRVLNDRKSFRNPLLDRIEQGKILPFRGPP